MQTNWYTITVEDVLNKLNTNKQGLSTEEAEQRIKTYGKNCLKEFRRKNALMRFLSQFHNILIYILIISSIITTFLHHWVDTSVIIGVIFLNALIGYHSRRKSRKSFRCHQTHAIATSNCHSPWKTTNN